MSTTFSLPSGWGDFQILQEGTRGTFSTGATATFVSQTPEITFMSDWNLAASPGLGTVDPVAVYTTARGIAFGLAFTNIVNETLVFVKRGINLAAGSGTIEYSFSGCLRTKIGAVTDYLKLKNCVIGGGAFGAVGGGPLQGSVAIGAILSAYDASAPTGWTFGSASTVFPYTGASGGTNPGNIIITNVTDPATLTPLISSWAVTFNRGLFPIPNLSVTPKDIIPTIRGVSIRYTVPRNSTDALTFWDAHDDGDEVNSSITISSPGVGFTLTGGKISPWTGGSATDSPAFESFQHIGRVAVLTTAGF